ncbi:MAG: type II toxin-antitoxin system VapC family toxin [Puniceicoccales bacterium]|jgi:hypothetical protein|nr:type II toxin-antitoxin system VapC family toxin [Puniceicoccales bacterium]
MQKKRVYVESSVISYLTARPARVLVKLAKQQQTWDWWEQRNHWELFISPVVIREIRRGDAEAARKRLSVVDGLSSVPETSEAQQLAEYLIAVEAVPEKLFDDAMHLAIAAIHDMDYLLMWNQTHLFNADRIEMLYKAIRKAGRKPAVLVRPDGLLETHHDS